MKKSFSLVPVSTSKAVVETDYLTDEAQTRMTADEEKRAMSEYEELNFDIERLEFEKEMTEIRAETTRKFYENLFAELLDEVEELSIQIEEKYADEEEYEVDFENEEEFENEDDDTDRHKNGRGRKGSAATSDIDDYLREAIEFPEDRDEVSDVSIDDEGFNNVDESAADYKRKCRKIYLAIVAKTHPDRCGNSSKVPLFRLAVAAFELLNLKALETIYEQVYGKPYGKTNLFERLLALRLRKKVLQNEINEIRRSNSWALHLLELEEGRESASKQYETALRNKISELRKILKGEFT